MDMRGRGAAAAADDIDEAGRGELADQLGHVLGALVITPELVRQSGIGIGAHQGVSDARNLSDVGTQFLGTERAVEPDRERGSMAHRIPERGRRLA